MWPFRGRRHERRDPPTLTWKELAQKGQVIRDGNDTIDALPLDERAKKYDKAYGVKRLRKRVKDAWDSQL